MNFLLRIVINMHMESPKSSLLAEHESTTITLKKNIWISNTDITMLPSGFHTKGDITMEKVWKAPI